MATLDWSCRGRPGQVMLLMSSALQAGSDQRPRRLIHLSSRLLQGLQRPTPLTPQSPQWPANTSSLVSHVHRSVSVPQVACTADPGTRRVPPMVWDVKLQIAYRHYSFPVFTTAAILNLDHVQQISQNKTFKNVAIYSDYPLLYSFHFISTSIFFLSLLILPFVFC